MRRAGVIVLIAALCVALLGLTGCYRRELSEDQRIDIDGLRGDERVAGDTVTSDLEVPLEDAQSLEASIRMGAGNLRLEVGGTDALGADFEYRPKSLRPEVMYEVGGGAEPVGRLTVEQPNMDTFSLGNYENTWELRMAEGVPLDLEVELGAGEADVLLGGLDLRSLKMEMGAGDATVDFSGDWDHDVSAEVEAGVGQLTLRFPEDVGVRVEGSREGIGSLAVDDDFSAQGDAFVNRAYDEATSTIVISVQRGVGEVRIESVR